MSRLSSPPGRLRDAAREYAERGWRLAPGHYLSAPGRHRRGGRHRPTEDTCSCRNPRCDQPGAHPLSPHWSIEATTDLYMLAYWWYGPQPWNIILPTGELFDVWQAPLGVATQALQTLRAASQPIGPVAHTPEGEWLFFTESRLGEPTPQLPPDLPVAYRGTGDYVLAPPSRLAGTAIRWWQPPAPAYPRMPNWEPIARALLHAARHHGRGPIPAVVPVPRAG